MKFHATVTKDQIKANWRLIRNEVCKTFSGDVVITFEELKDKRSLQQLRYFHGPLLKSVQEFYQETEGMTYTFDRVKHMLKVEYLGYSLQYWDDETPKLVGMPDLNGNIVMVHFSTLPTLANIGFEEMKQFISMIIQDFVTVKGWHIPEPEELIKT